MLLKYLKAVQAAPEVIAAVEAVIRLLDEGRIQPADYYEVLRPKLAAQPEFAAPEAVYPLEDLVDQWERLPNAPRIRYKESFSDWLCQPQLPYELRATTDIPEDALSLIEVIEQAVWDKRLKPAATYEEMHCELDALDFHKEEPHVGNPHDALIILAEAWRDMREAPESESQKEQGEEDAREAAFFVYPYPPVEKH